MIKKVISHRQHHRNTAMLALRYRLGTSATPMQSALPWPNNLTPAMPTPTDTLYASLIAAGLLRERRPPGPAPHFEPVPVQGEPVSQTIIEDRR